ncbi:pyridoxamine 5'-phosphate oxidase family protein [Kineococcus sp. LSe6-4]|uniref:Pyridoxamine 5'-phosphate oxidase family protein n=1 Tax=Kineococcus halophytocola TaxID=3234027 RepID=A0ABV4H1S5_9ACTN
MHTVKALEPADCRRLLGTSGAGRVVFTQDALPAVLPTLYVVSGDRLWFPVTERGPLHQHVDGAVLAYHVDRVDRGERSGWSVTVVGACHTVDPAHAPVRAHGLARGPAGRLLAVEMDHLTGRELGRAGTTAPAPAPGWPA